MFDKYLIDMTNPNDCLCWRKGKLSVAGQSKFTPAFGPEQKDEIGDIVYLNAPIENAVHDKFHEIFYHEHLDGCETFFFVDGEWEAIHMGKQFKVHPGDILHVQPFQGHGFRPLSPFCRLIVSFQSKDMRYALERRDYVKAKFPEIAASPEFQAQQLIDTHDMPRSREYYYDIAPEGDSPAHRRFGEGIRTYAYPGIKLNLLVARYETHGVKETWEMEMKKGLRLEFTTPRYDHRIFWVRDGRVRFNIDGSEFTACKDNMVYVPPYHTFTFEVEEDANMVDMSCPYYLEELLEEFYLLQMKSPEKCADETTLRELYVKYKSEPIKYSYNA